MFKENPDEKIIFGGIFILFSAIIVGATLYYAPWWGVVDDARNLVVADGFWKHPGIGSFCGMVKAEIGIAGRFRPIYNLWVISAYSLFRNFPVGVYLCMALAGLATLLVWGKMINKIFSASRNKSFDFFIYPLSFFIFTPFWNNFMYITVLEKFVYFFASFSLYFYIRAYESGKVVYIFISLAFMVLGILSKETGVALAGVYCLYSILDYLLFHKNRKLSLVGLTGSISFIIGYYFLMSGICNVGYSGTYRNNFNITTIYTLFLASPLVVKGLIFTAAIFALVGTVFVARDKHGVIRQEYILFPFFLGAYLITISPLTFINYYMAPIAPFLMATLYPVYMLISAGSAARRKAFQGILIILVFLVLFFIIIPRISKMGDIKNIVSAIVSMRDEPEPARFFMAPPFHETACMLQSYTNTNITYLNDGLLDADMLKDETRSYIIFEDRCSSVTLRDVIAEKEVYHNGTWRVFSLNKTIGNVSALKPVFGRNLLQRVKDCVKSVR